MAVARRMRAMLKRFAERRKREERLRAERRRMAVERRMRAMFKRRAEMRRVAEIAERLRAARRERVERMMQAFFRKRAAMMRAKRKRAQKSIHAEDLELLE